MGGKQRKKNRRRKRGGAAPRPAKAPSATPPEPARGRKPLSHKASLDEAPKPIWHPIPLTEIFIFLGIVVAVTGMFSRNLPAVIGGIVVLGSASTELAVREHFAGYRSHSAMIAGLVAMGVGTALALLLGVLNLGIPVWSVLVVAGGLFGWLFYVLRRGFEQRTGLTFRV